MTLTGKEEVVKTSIERDRERKRAFTVTGFLFGLRISGHNPPTHFYACFTWLDGRLSGVVRIAESGVEVIEKG